MINMVHNENCLNTVEEMKRSGVKVDCIVTSPPYWQLRDYGHLDQLGQEKDYDMYVSHLIELFLALKRS